VLGPARVFDQATVEELEDMLVYASARLTTPLRIAGPVSVTLFAASSAVDTDFTTTLVNVPPDGYCANLAEGIMGAWYRHSLEKEDLLEPGSNSSRYNRNLNAEVNPSLAPAGDLQVATPLAPDTAVVRSGRRAMGLTAH
jgi:predicted acyl esterase